MTHVSQPDKVSDVLLIAMESAQFGPCGTQLPRVPWAVRVLVEQLIIMLPEGSTRDAVLPLRDPKRGVTTRNIAPVLRQLTAESLIIPNGVRADAVWTITDAGHATLDTLRSTLPRKDARAVQAASQRAMAIVVALSKAARA